MMTSVEWVQIIHIMISFLLLVWLSKLCSTALVGAAADLTKPSCQASCGGVDIPFPFGIGIGSERRRDCYFDEWFEVSCNNTSINGTTSYMSKPFLKRLGVEVLNISLESSTIRVNNPVLIYQNCSGRPSRDGMPWEGGPFSFSDKLTRLTGVGCNSLAYIVQNDEEVIGGCMSFCKPEGGGRKTAATTLNGICYGLECCQTQLPPGLRNITVIIELYANGPDHDEEEKCKYAFMVEEGGLPENVNDARKVKDVGYAPAVLDWRIYKTASSSAFRCAANATTLPDNQTSGLTCECRRGYQGNPYLPHGCQLTDNGQRFPQRFCSLDGNGHHSCRKPRGTSMVLPGIAIGVGTLLMVIFGWWMYIVLKRRNQIKYQKKCFKRNGGLLLEQHLSSTEGSINKTKLFTSKELEQATDHYNENRVIGQGGQGTVYKGMLIDGRIVAAKKLKMMGERKLQEFINEIVILSQINHRNVVKLLGCCLEAEIPLLVYEFIPNGTLSEHIHDENEDFPITWEMRLRIAAEVAGALSYLHSEASVRIYHRDIKSTNILLDEKYRAKVADFGTSKSIVIDQTHLTTQVQGTFGYLDPEYFQSSQFTEKSDVYSFGIVLIELLTGEKPILTTSTEGKSLATHFVSSMKENRLSNILDARVVKEGKQEAINAFAHLAKRCINLNGKKRPTMMEVAMELERIRKCQGDVWAQDNYQEVVDSDEIKPESWDVTTSMESSFICTDASSSSHAQH